MQVVSPPSIPSPLYSQYANTDNVNINTKEISVGSSATSTNNLSNGNDDSSIIDYRDMTQSKTDMTKMPFSDISEDKIAKLESGIGVSVSINDKEIALIPKLAQEQLESLKNGKSVSFAHEDGQTYTLDSLPEKKTVSDNSQPPSLEDMLVTIKSNSGKTKQAVLPPNHLPDNDMMAKDASMQYSNTDKEAIMQRMTTKEMHDMPKQLRDFKMVSGGIYRNDNEEVFARMQNGNMIYRGFKI